MSKRMEMRRKIQQNQQKLREKKKKEEEEKKKNKPYVSPFERKHGRKPSRSDDMPKSKKSTLTGKERAQALAKKNIKKHGGTAKAAAANKEAMRLKIKKRYQESQKKKKKK